MPFVSLFLLFLFIKNCFESIIKGKYPKAIILPSGNFLIILESGLYVYNSDFSLIKAIYTFPENEKIDNDEEYNKIALSEIKLDNIFYIFCLTKNNILFSFENNDYQFNKYYLSDLIIKGNYYSINLKEYENQEIKILISFISRENESDSKYKFILNYYVYNVDLSEFNRIKNISVYNNKKKYRDIIECQTESLQLKDIYFNCFSEYSSDIYVPIFNNYDSCSNNIMKIKSYKSEINSNYVLYWGNGKEHNNQIQNIQDIKFSFSKKDSKSLICYRYMQVNTQCIYYQFEDDTFHDIGYNIENCLKLETFFFDETNIYIIICIINDSENNIQFKLITLNNNFSQGNIAGKNEITITLKECEVINKFSLVYSKFTQDYILIADCYNSNIGWFIYYNNIINFNNTSFVDSCGSTSVTTSNYSNSVSDSVFDSDNTSSHYSSSDSSQISNTNINSNLNLDYSTILYSTTVASFIPTNHSFSSVPFYSSSTSYKINTTIISYSSVISSTFVSYDSSYNYNPFISNIISDFSNIYETSLYNYISNSNLLSSDSSYIYSERTNAANNIYFPPEDYILENKIIKNETKQKKRRNSSKY